MTVEEELELHERARKHWQTLGPQERKCRRALLRQSKLLEASLLRRYRLFRDVNPTEADRVQYIFMKVTERSDRRAKAYYGE